MSVLVKATRRLLGTVAGSVTCSEASSQSGPQRSSGGLVPKQSSSSRVCTETCSQTIKQDELKSRRRRNFDIVTYFQLTYRRWRCWFRFPEGGWACSQKGRWWCRRTGHWWWWCRTRLSCYRINSAAEAKVTGYVKDLKLITQT